MIFRGPLDVKKIYDAGYRFSYPVVCGQQFTRDNTVAVMHGVGLTPDEIAALDYLARNGVEIIFDPSCTNENISWEQVKATIKS